MCEMKICEDCGRELPVSAFPRNGKRADGSTRRRPDCKLCYAAKRKGNKKKHDKFLRNDKVRTGVQPELSLMDWAQSLANWDGKCMYCGAEHSRRRKLTRDHIQPVSKGGKTTKYNIGPACRFCNTSKNNSEMEEWFRKQKFFSEEKLKKIKEWQKCK